MGQSRCNRSLHYKSVLIFTVFTNLLARNGPTRTLSLVQHTQLLYFRACKTTSIEI